MRKYNRERRGTYNARTNKHRHTDENRERRSQAKRIHIHIHYDGYNHIEYIPIIYKKTRNNKAHTYIGVTNVMREIFKDIDTHTGKVYRGTATYHKFIPQATTYTRPEPDPDIINKDTRTVKCIIMNDNEEIMYIGKMRRTRTVNHTKGTINITLHRGTRTMQAYERAINPDRIIHSITVREIKAHDVEIYYI